MTDGQAELIGHGSAEEQRDPAAEGVAADGRTPAAAAGRVEDPTYATRLKALLSTAPLHELDASKGQRAAGGVSWEGLDLTGLSLSAIDEAVDHMGLVGDGLTFDSLADALADIAFLHDGGLPVGEARRAAGEVVRQLLNDADNRRAFVRGYADPGAGYERLRHTFRLLEERDDPERGVVLKASREAVNLIKCALEQDLEDAQVANAAVLRSQMLRGRIDAATATDREARRLSNLYAEEIVRALETTRRDIRRAGWDGTVPRLLADALAHLAARLADTNELLEHAQRHLAGGEVRGEPDERTGRELRSAVELVDLLEDCRRTHSALHARLLDAYPTFLEEQDRQVFARPAVVIDFAPWPDLLEPTLALARAEAVLGRLDVHVASHHLGGVQTAQVVEARGLPGDAGGARRAGMCYLLLPLVRASAAVSNGSPAGGVSDRTVRSRSLIRAAPMSPMVLWR